MRVSELCLPLFVLTSMILETEDQDIKIEKEKDENCLWNDGWAIKCRLFSRALSKDQP